MGIGSDIAASAGLPAVAHIVRPVRCDQHARTGIETVAAPFHPSALFQPGHLDRDIAPQRRVGHHLAVGPQPGDTAVGLQSQPQMGPSPVIPHGQQIVRIRFQHGAFHHGRPRHPGPGRVLGAVQCAGVHGAGGGVVTGEEPGVHVDGVQPARCAQPDDGPVAVRAGVAPGLPAVDHLAAQIVGAGHEGRL